MSYIVFNSTIEIDGQVFYEGVSLAFDGTRKGDFYVIGYNDKEYRIPAKDVVVSNRPTRTENISNDMYLSKRYNDKTKDYIEAVQKAYNIDMRLNYLPQFRDGRNPFKDESNNKEII